MIVKTRHTGMVVRDMNASVAFYEALGFKVWRRELEEGPFIDTVVGIPQVRVETAKLKAKDDSMLELLQYHSHPLPKPFVRAPSNQLGCSHMAFSVDDIESMCRLVQDMGGAIVNPPALAPSGRVKVAYIHDIDGILLELVEELN